MSNEKDKIIELLLTMHASYERDIKDAFTQEDVTYYQGKLNSIAEAISAIRNQF